MAISRVMAGTAPGVAHGVAQPVMLGQWHCKIRADQDFAPLDLATANWIPEPLPTAIAAAHDAASLLLHMLFWVGAAQPPGASLVPGQCERALAGTGTSGDDPGFRVRCRQSGNNRRADADLIHGQRQYR